MSDNAQQKDSAANNADQPPPPQKIAGQTTGEAEEVPTLTRPPPRKKAETTGTDSEKKKKENRRSKIDRATYVEPAGDPRITAFADSLGTTVSKGPAGPKTPPETPRDSSKIRRRSRQPSKKRESRESSSNRSRDASSKRKESADSTPSVKQRPTFIAGVHTVDKLGNVVATPAPSGSAKPAKDTSKGSAEPTSASSLSGFKIPKLRDTRPVRSEKEEEAARNREKNLNSKNYTKERLLPHYQKGSHPMNEEEADDWSDSRHPTDKQTPARRGGLVSSFVALGPNADKYKPQPKGPAGPTRDKKRSHSSPPSDSDDEVRIITPQEQRDRQHRSLRSQVVVPRGSAGFFKVHSSRDNSATRPAGLFPAARHPQSRSRSQVRSPNDPRPSTPLVQRAQDEMVAKTKELYPRKNSAEVSSDQRTRSAGSKTSQKTAKKPSVCNLTKPLPDFQHPLGQIVLHDEPAGSTTPIPKVARSLRVPRKKPYTPFVDANIRKDRILQLRDDAKKQGKRCPVNWNWYWTNLRNENESLDLEFAISHFVHPGALVPHKVLPLKPGILPPTIQQCAAENELYPNEFIHGITEGCHPAVAFLADDIVRGLIQGQLASATLHGYVPVGIFTGLDFGSTASEAYPKWTGETHAMWVDQVKVFEAFIDMALNFMAAGLRRPLCLTLYSRKGCVYNAIEDALEILQLKKVPNTFPFFLTNWSGTPSQAWKWLRAFPNTIIGLTYDYVLTKSDDGSEQFFKELPFSNMVLESGCPKRRCDKQYATSATCIETACALGHITEEDPKHIMEQTAWTSLKFFFPGTPRPLMWASTPSTQVNPRRFLAAAEKHLALDQLAANANQNASADARRAGGLPTIAAGELRKKIAEEQFDKNNQPILDKMQDEDDSIFNKFMMDFSPNVETFQEMDIRQERAADGQGQLAKQSTEASTEQSTETITEQQAESADSNDRTQSSPPPLNYDTEAAAAAKRVVVLEKTAAIASRLVFPKGNTFAEKKADAAKIVAAIEKSKEQKAQGFDRDPNDVVLEYPEFDDSYWDIEACPRPFRIEGPEKQGRWSILIPGPTRTYFEPLADCRDHDVNHNPHLRIRDAVTSYRNLCKPKGQLRQPERAGRIGNLHIDSHGKMFAILWASRHNLKPRKNPEDKTEVRQANEVVLDFMNTVARSSSAELPQKFNQYFDAIREGQTDEPFTPYDFRAAIIKWYDSCPHAADFFKKHATGPILYQPTFLDSCRQDIREAYLRVAQPHFREAMDWARMRYYQVVMSFQRPWTLPRDVNFVQKDFLVKVTVDTKYILQEEQVMFVDSWGQQFTDNLKPNVVVIVLSDLLTEAIPEIRKYLMGHLVCKIYWFHGAAAFRLRADGYGTMISNVAQHFVRMFPYVRFHVILAPFTEDRRDAWHSHLHDSVMRFQNACLNATVIMHPTDMELCQFYEECARLRIRNPQWPTDEHTPEGQLSDEGLSRRKEYMEVHYEVELWLQRQHDPEAERQEQQAAQELEDELDEAEGQTRLMIDEASSQEDDQSIQDTDALEEPAGSYGTTWPTEDDDTDSGEPAGSSKPMNEETVRHATATAHVTPKDPSEELKEFYNRTFNTTTGKKPHRYDYLPKAQPPKPKSTIEDFMKRAASDARARKIKTTESSTAPPDQEHRQAEEYPSRPSTSETTSDLSDAPLQLPHIEPAGSAYASILLQSFKLRFDIATQQPSNALEQLLARMNEDSDGEYTRRVFAQLEQANLLGPSGPQPQPTILLERLQLNSSEPTTEQTEPTTPLPTDESSPSMQTQDNSKVSADTTEQAVPTTATDEPLDEPASEDDGSLDETDNASQSTDPYSGPSHGLDWS